MQLLGYFIRKYRFFLFFLLLEFIAFSLIIQNHSFHKSKFVSSANEITGGIFEKTSNLKQYLHLAEENDNLTEENLQLRRLINNINFTKSNPIDTGGVAFLKGNFEYFKAKVIKNSFKTNYNFLLVDLGLQDSIKPEMAVFNHKGIIGITENSSSNYTRIQSILNLDSNINAKFKKNDYYGSLTWNGQDYKIVQLIDVERQAPVELGDTVVTGGRSAIFPEGIPIGKVIRKNQNTTITSSIDIELFNDMSHLRNVYIAENKDQREIRNLENSNE